MMGWNDYPLRSLTLPQDASGTDSRRVIGPDIPVELQEFGSSAYTWHFADLWYFPDGNYYWEALVTNEVFGTVQQMSGVYLAGVVTLYQIHEDSADPSIKIGSDLYNADRITFALRKTDFVVTSTATLNVEDPILDNGTLETWHPMTLVNGWTGTVAVRNVASPPNTVQIMAETAPGTKVDGTLVFTLPPQYRPIRVVNVPVTCNATVAGGQDPHFNINSATGNVTCWGLSVAAVSGCHALFPTDI